MDFNTHTVHGFENNQYTGPLPPPPGATDGGLNAAATLRIPKTRDSLLDQKGFLQFEFSNPTDPDGPPRVVRLPFFEDPEIRESKSAKYASYKPISRASELFSYLGSDARNFQVTFKMTIPHLVAMYNSNVKKSTGSYNSEQQEISKFFENSSFRTSNDISPAAYSYKEKYSPSIGPTQEELSLLGFPLTPEGYAEWYNAASLIEREKGNAVLDVVTYWVDLIRSSTYNNVQNPIFGPPIVKLTFGMLFRAIPCICTSYSLAYDPNTGYDKETLMPRVLKIDMDLKENRAGDFGTFDASKPDEVAGENLAGWEAVITDNTNQIGGTLDVIPSI